MTSPVQTSADKVIVPTVAAPAPLKVPAVLERTLPNGLRVLAVRRASVPVVELRLRIPVGPPGKKDKSSQKVRLAAEALLSETMLAGTAQHSRTELVARMLHLSYRDAHVGALVSGKDRNLMFQRIGDYTPPRWPDPAHPQQAHLDLWVEDLDTGEARAVELGATRLKEGGERFRVFTDPAGHPFCLIS